MIKITGVDNWGLGRGFSPPPPDLKHVYVRGGGIGREIKGEKKIGEKFY